MKQLLRPTRGFGILEGFLAIKRAKMANQLLLPCSPGRILDIGCGQYPVFLEQSRFQERYGLDREKRESQSDMPSLQGITLSKFDSEVDNALPFQSCFFDAVTMLAVVEHITRTDLPGVFSEVHRVLKDGGRFVLTTPARKTETLLRALAWVGFLSSSEIDDHKMLYSSHEIGVLLEAGGFDRNKIEFGFFEAHLNTYVVAKK